MGALKTQTGYTMTETMIVLAVTAAVFGTTVVMISGQIAKHRFRDSVNTANQIIQDALNDVQTGYFEPIDTIPTGPSGCDVDYTGPGTSKCVFAGKRVDIAADGTITRTSLWTAETTMPASTNDMDDGGSPYSTVLPKGVDYSNELSFYVLYQNYGGDSLNTGGAQAYGVRYEGAGNSLETKHDADAENASICITDGQRSARIFVGIDGSMTTKIDFEATCS